MKLKNIGTAYKLHKYVGCMSKMTFLCAGKFKTSEPLRGYAKYWNIMQAIQIYSLYTKNDIPMCKKIHNKLTL